MSFGEILIIYFSLGAPVAVYHYQHLTKLRENAAAARSLLAFALWPAALVTVFVRSSDDPRTRISGSSSPDASDELLEQIFDIAKRELDTAGRGGELRHMREVLERYAGLTRANQASGNELRSAVEFYKVAGHPAPRIAAACRTRHASSKVRDHARAAAEELKGLFSKLDASDHFVRAVESLARELGDVQTADFLFALSNAPNNGVPSVGEIDAARAA